MAAYVDTKKFNPNKVIVNYLPDALTNDELSALFGTVGEMTSVRIVRDSATKMSLGYGFVEYKHDCDAAKAIQAFNGLTLQNKRLSVAYARWPAGSGEQNAAGGANVHIRNLEQTVTADDVEQQFGQYGEVVRARVLKDPNTGFSRGIAFVLFAKREDAEQAVESMNGATIPGFAHGQLTVRFAVDNKTKAQALFTARSMMPEGIGGYPTPNLGSIMPGGRRFTTPQIFPPSRLAAATASRQMLMGSEYEYASGGGPIHNPNAKRRFNPMLPAAAAMSATAVKHIMPNALLRLPTAAAANAATPQVPVLTGTQAQAMTVTDPSPAGFQHPAIVAAGNTGYVLFVYNLAPDSSELELWRLFGPFGAVQKINVVKDPEKDKCKGYAFVTMTNFDEAMIAITNMDGFVYKEKALQVSLKTQRQKSI